MARISLQGLMADPRGGASFEGRGRRRFSRHWTYVVVGFVHRRSSTAIMTTRNIIRYRPRGLNRSYETILGTPSPVPPSRVIDRRSRTRLVDRGITRSPDRGVRESAFTGATALDRLLLRDELATPLQCHCVLRWSEVLPVARLAQNPFSIVGADELTAG